MPVYNCRVTRPQCRHGRTAFGELDRNRRDVRLRAPRLPAIHRSKNHKNRSGAGRSRRKGPFGAIYPGDALDSVVLYRGGRNGVICFDSFRSKELRDRLSPEPGRVVRVEYDPFSDCGKVRGYNVPSVAGITLANGYHVLQPWFAAAAGIVGSSTRTTASANDCR
jgi:hypothetical protein